MSSRVQRFGARVLPRGWGDWLRQVVLFCGAYYAYRIVRGIVDEQAGVAFHNADQIVSFERSLHLFFEPDVQSFAQAHHLLVEIASWLYVNSHFVVTTFVLAWMYLRRNERFYFVRNMFMVAMGIALVMYAVFPTAPPRFLPDLGFTDSVARFTGTQPDSGAEGVLFNPYAAMPSTHVCFALMIGIPMSQLAGRRWARVLWRAYPLLITWAVIATANHWWLDTAVGALTAAVAAGFAAGLFARVRPEAWAWDRAPQAAGA